MRRKGFSFIESLIALSFSLVILLTSLEFFGFARRIFFKLKEREETWQGAVSALDKVKIDVLQSGQGLLIPMTMGLVEAISQTEEALVLQQTEKKLNFQGDLTRGQTRISLEDARELKKGREICLFDPHKGEIRMISSVEGESIILSSPLSFSYANEESTLYLMEKISFFLDAPKDTLRRRVNSSPAQPLLEDVSHFASSYEKDTNLVKISLCLKNNKEKTHEISVFPKNTALHKIR